MASSTWPRPCRTEPMANPIFRESGRSRVRSTCKISRPILGPGELPIQPWAEALTNERKTGIHAREEPQANCLPPGLPRINATPLAFKIYQQPGVVLVLYEAF